MHVTIDGQAIFFDVVGAKLGIDGPRLIEKPTVVVMHGGPGFDHAGMRPDFDQLADIAQVLYVDHRGNGRSVPSDPATWTLDRWGDDVKALCDTLGIARPIVFGQSFGGMVAQSYAIRHPGHAAGIVISSSAARMDFPAAFAAFERKGGREARAIAERYWSTLSEADQAEYARVCLPLYLTHTPRDPDQMARATRRLEVARHFSKSGGEVHSMDFRPRLKDVRSPALVIGGIEDPITPPHLSEEIAAHLPKGSTELRLFAGCGHGAYRDEPQTVWPVVRAFIERTGAA